MKTKKTLKSINKSGEINRYKLYQNPANTRLLILPNRNETATATIFFYFKVGSKNERPDIHGISHFIEHMLYKGSTNFRNYLDISKTFDAHGISYNAYTSKDITAYHYKFLSTADNLDLICKITADMLFHPLMRDSDIRTERNVIIQELKDDDDNIDEFIDNKLESLVFEGHPLACPIIGTVKSLKGITRAGLTQYHQEYYNPANLLITVSGKMPVLFKNCITKYFPGAFKPVSLGIQRSGMVIPYVEKHLTTTIHCIPKSVQQDYIHILFKTRGYFDPNILAYKLLANILGGNMSSRLFVEIREKLGLAYTVKCDITYYEEVGYFDIITQNETSQTVKCITNILKQLEKIKREPIPVAELEGNKRNYCDIFQTNFDDIEYENEYYAKQLLFNKPFEPSNLRIQNIQNLTSQELLNAAQELFDFQKMHIITFGNIKKSTVENTIKEYMA
jgi:predicted Zn-dependent peptidase